MPMAINKPRFRALKSIANFAQKHKKIIAGCFAVGALGGGLWSTDSSRVTLKPFYVPKLPKSIDISGPEYISLPSGITYDYIVDDYPEESTTSWFKRSKHGEKFMHWKLLQLARSKSRNVRQLALKALVELPGMTDAEYREIAQASDFDCCVGFARIQGTDPRFFLPPPPIPADLAIDRIENELRRVLLYLPVQESDPCLQIFTFSALKTGIGDDQALEWRYSDQPELIGADEKLLTHSLQEATVYRCLEALLRHSTFQNTHQLMIQHGLLPLLQRVKDRWPDNKVFNSLIAQILGNLALDSQMHRYIFKSGWVGILASWFNEKSTLEVSLPAARALVNLDQDNGFQETYLDGVYPFYPLQRSRDDKLEADIVFVHGLLGGAFKTWRQHDSRRVVPVELMHEPYSQCWPKDWLSTDFPKCRILAVDYDSQLSNWRKKCPLDEKNRTLASRSQKLKEQLLAAGLGDRPIIWIAHSMGGLLVRELLLEAWDSDDEQTNRLVENTRGLVFCSVPHKGSPLANLKPSLQFLFLPSTEVTELKNTPQMQKKHDRFVSLLEDNNINCLSFGETRRMALGFRWTLLVVPPESADPGVGTFHPLPINHLDSCKPEDKMSPLYYNLVRFIWSCLYTPEETLLLSTQGHRWTFLDMLFMNEFS